MNSSDMYSASYLSYYSLEESDSTRGKVSTIETRGKMDQSHFFLKTVEKDYVKQNRNIVKSSDHYCAFISIIHTLPGYWELEFFFPKLKKSSIHKKRKIIFLHSRTRSE